MVNRKRGVSSNKIVIPKLLFQDNALYVPDLKKIVANDFENNINGIICGLSYSLRGIDTARLVGNIVDFSWHGLDLYYNYLQLDFFLNFYTKNLEYALLVFPYYYFNYDMFSSLYQYESAQIMACHGFNDWHNAINSQDERIKEYLINFELFGEKFWKLIEWRKFCAKNKNIIREKQYLSNIWKKNYNSTQKENIEIFEKILKVLQKRVNEIYIIIPPIYVTALDSEDRNWIKICKRNFYDIIHSCDITDCEIIDYSEVFNKNSKLFYDYEHLNEAGKIKFTELLNELLVSN